MTDQVDFLLRIIEETSSAKVASRARELRAALREEQEASSQSTCELAPQAPGTLCRQLIEELRADDALCKQLQELVTRTLTFEYEPIASELLEVELRPGGRIANAIKAQLESRSAKRGRS